MVFVTSDREDGRSLAFLFHDLPFKGWQGEFSFFMRVFLEELAPLFDFCRTFLEIASEFSITTSSLEGVIGCEGMAWLGSMVGSFGRLTWTGAQDLCKEQIMRSLRPGVVPGADITWPSLVCVTPTWPWLTSLIPAATAKLGALVTVIDVDSPWWGLQPPSSSVFLHYDELWCSCSIDPPYFLRKTPFAEKGIARSHCLYCSFTWFSGGPSV